MMTEIVKMTDTPTGRDKYNDQLYQQLNKKYEIEIDATTSWSEPKHASWAEEHNDKLDRWQFCLLHKGKKYHLLHKGENHHKGATLQYWTLFLVLVVVVIMVVVAAMVMVIVLASLTYWLLIWVSNFCMLHNTPILSTGVLGECYEELWEWDLEDGGEPGEGDASLEQHEGPNGERPGPSPAHTAQPWEDVPARGPQVPFMGECVVRWWQVLFFNQHCKISCNL